MNRLFTLFAALLVGVVASAQNFVIFGYNKDYVLFGNIMDGEKYEYSYGENGLVLCVNDYTEYDELTGSYSKFYKTNIGYDEKGNEVLSITKKLVDDDWEEVSRFATVNTYDANGVLIEYNTDFYDCEELSDHRNYELIYDEKGNVIQRTLTMTSYGFSDEGYVFPPEIKTSEYNEKNLLTAEISEDITLRYSYDEKDRIISIVTDWDGDVTIEKITYNADGTEAVGKHYEADGVTLKTDITDSKYFFTKKTATPSRRAELDHVGAYNFKTVENGQVVIVKDGEKYDLAGRKL